VALRVSSQMVSFLGQKGTGKSADQFRQRNIQGDCDAKKSLHRDRAPFFNLLPVSSRESEVDHVFLGIVTTLPERPHPLAQSTEEFGRIQHVHSLRSDTCKNTTSRLAGQLVTLVLYVRGDFQAIRDLNVESRVGCEESTAKPVLAR
jgi:hypothetical protein